MYTTDAFGNRRIQKPLRLRFLTEEEQKAADKAAADKAIADKAVADALAKQNELGFPANTPVAEMTDAQQAAYWRNESKKQQAIADSRKDYDEKAEKAAAHDTYVAEHATDEEKAREQARREGEVIGAEKYLKDAVVGKFQALTGRTDEEVAATFEHVDPKSFLDDKGEIVAEKITAFAATFGLKAAGGKEDAVAAALARTRTAGGGTGTSIAEKRKEVRESMTQKSNA